MELAYNRALSQRSHRIGLRNICALRSTRIGRLDPAARPGWHRKLAVDDLDAGKRIVEHAAELAELAGIVDARKRGGEMDRMRVAEPGADVRAEAILHVAGLADAGRRECVAQAAELLNLEADCVN